MSQSEINAYLAQLTPQEQKVLKIAQEHLESSFSLVKSIGFQDWLKNAGNCTSLVSPAIPVSIAIPAIPVTSNNVTEETLPSSLPPSLPPSLPVDIPAPIKNVTKQPVIGKFFIVKKPLVAKLQ